MALPGGYLLDTNILVHLLRNNDLGRYLDATYHLLAPITPQVLSVVTVGETGQVQSRVTAGGA